MHDEKSLENTTHKLVVNKRMQDGSKYFGQVCKHTRGVWFRSKNNLKSDVQDGFGTSRWLNGVKYSGIWKNGVAHGQGKFTFKSGVTVEVIFRNNIAMGDGFLTDLKGPK